MSDTAEERTEQATQKRMKDVRQKGKLTRSQDLTAWVGVGAAAVMVPTTIGLAAQAGATQAATFTSVIANPEPARAVAALGDGLGSITASLTPLFAVVAIAVLIAAATQGGIHFRQFKPRTEQFNPVTGLKRIFGLQALWEGAKALLKVVVIALVLWVVIQGMIPVLSSAGGLPVTTLLDTAGSAAAALLQTAVIAGLALAAIDLFVVMRRNRKQTRMTKKEVKDENKSSDGDPLIKSQRRSRQLALSRNRMIAAVGSADVVLLNPTHIAVALTYEPGKSAPRVVAKGSGEVAARIREEAEKHRVPMVRDVPLARAVHAACEIGQEIPVELYNAVARVLVFVMSLKTRGAGQGVHTMTQSAA
ncbi:EscU/YscU/HrcU family type III secretion system export apparatus switch protein [Diaminobutyricimonas sp. TR449]|uniref:EscU/YscU/HrcU family type III secretion system export apparatus switch protein n=1 Tax=Diaminobutyricimonas sp. TR449 TaxID=2708076 RepID=UPI001422D80C|nr:EscU/YscU/HrcU family type III secretion system export apparatus switch protein [Diaminobutyricimonas sp. TR449]